MSKAKQKQCRRKGKEGARKKTKKSDKNVNNHELILDFVCCHHQQVECPLSQIKWQRK